MAWQTILTAVSTHTLTVTLDRPSRRNALNDSMIAELHAALDDAERSPRCRLLVIQGANGVFCTGMDLANAAADVDSSTHRGAAFFRLLRRFTASSQIVVSIVDGRVEGGGVGLVAASDFALATERARFGLPEALWGLLPCSVLPFLLRRVGFQRAYAMTLSTLPVNAREAKEIGLVDEVADDPAMSLQRLASRVTKLDESTVLAAKRYFDRLSPITEEVETSALNELDALFASTFVQQAIAGFTGPRRSLPWER
jgi:polyketide biosynthesis enoyl-CoA hydratase PksH